jgi:superfamily II helicase
MLLTHTLNVNVEFDKDNTPDYVINALVTYSEKEIQKLLSEVLINSLNEIKALEKINENNSYAKVSWGDN